MHARERYAIRFLIALVLAATGAVTVAAEETPGIPDELMNNSGFLNAHPDLKHRQLGGRAYSGQRFEQATREFTRAALHADKPSQAMLAEIHWSGSGVPVDRALAYAWMDLAAERRYRQFLLRREFMWSQLGESEQTRAIEMGQQIYDRYGDKVAKPRLEAEMRRAFRTATGSRVNPGHLKLSVSTGSGMPKPAAATFSTIDDVSNAAMGQKHDYYADRYWVAASYWKLQDDQWSDRPTHAVIVQPLQTEADSQPSR